MTTVDTDILSVEEPTGEELKAPPGVSPVLWDKWMNEAAVKNDKFLWQLKRGIQGHNVGLDNGLKAINKYIYGTHKARYYLIGAESGAGKTTISDFMFILNAWESAKKQGRKLKVFYCSFEIGKVEKQYRWASYYIFIKYGIRLPSDYLQGRITGRKISPEHLNMVLEAYTIITELMSCIVFCEDILHPTKIFEGIIDEHFAQPGIGIVHRAPISDADKKKGKKGYVTGYDEIDPSYTTILYIDHLALTGTEMNLETKGIMDKMSKYMIVLRNLFHCTGVFIQQFSVDMMSTYRSAYGKKPGELISPQRIDFGDSKATYRDADVVIGYVKPTDAKEFKINDALKYSLSKFDGLGDCFVMAYLMKNRYGPSTRQFPLFLDGVSGCVYDLPTESNLFATEQWYNKAKQIEKVCLDYCPISQ